MDEKLANKKIKLVKEESFFTTVEGEAKLTGTLIKYMRATGCTLSCAWKNDDGTVSICDTPFSSHLPSFNIVTVQQAYDTLMEGNHKWVSISGGELHLQPSILQLVDLLEDSGKRVKLETNGTIFIPSKASLVCISPKLKSSEEGLKLFTDLNFKQQDNNNFLKTTDFNARAIEYQQKLDVHQRDRYRPEVLKQFIDHYGPERYLFKFVVNTEADLEEMQNNYINLLNIPNENVWLMPQGINSDHLNQKAQWIIELCKKYGYNYSDRLHIRVYGSKAGV
jgi:organic radical activating enzyme